MDQALLKQREAFLKRAKAQPVVEKRKSKPSSDETPSKKAKPNRPPQPKAPSKWFCQFDHKDSQDEYDW